VWPISVLFFWGKRTAKTQVAAERWGKGRRTIRSTQKLKDRRIFGQGVKKENRVVTGFSKWANGGKERWHGKKPAEEKGGATTRIKMTHGRSCNNVNGRIGGERPARIIANRGRWKGNREWVKDLGPSSLTGTHK